LKEKAVGLKEFGFSELNSAIPKHWETAPRPMTESKSRVNLRIGGESIMDTIIVGRRYDQLNRRHKQLAATLGQLAKQKQEVERNTDWLDQAAYENRVKLLDQLDNWYRMEMAQIDKALSRIEQKNYGLCLACHEPIDARRLESAPEAEFCAGCKALHENIERANLSREVSPENHPVP
jgi:DnaK suppressor protein